MTTIKSPVIRGLQTREEKLQLDYGKSILPFVPSEVDDFETEATRYLKGEWESEDLFTMYRLIRGVYGQRQSDVNMMRVKIPSGAMTADQLDAFGEVVTNYAPLKKAHITTRENIQIHFLKIADTPAIMRILGAAGLTSREACGNTVRNVAGDPLSGVAPDEPFYVGPYLAAYTRWFIRHPFTQALPRKFKTAFTSGAIDTVVADIHDLAFLPRVRQGPGGEEERGFEMRVGGGTSIMPRIAWTLYDFVPVSEYLRVSEAVIRVFHRTDELRKNRMRARIKFHVDKVGIDVFRAEVEEELTGEWAKADFDPTPLMELPPELEEDPPPLVPVPEIEESEAFSAWKGSNVFPQAQEGYNCVFVTLPLGDIASDQFGPLADIARNFAGGRLRTTAEQNLLYRWVPEGYLHAFWTALEAIGLSEDGANQITDVVACPGTDSCKMGITSAMGVSIALRKSIREFGTKDPLIRELHVKVSGCPNGCSRHHIANIGFHGAVTKGDGNHVPAYEVFLAGNYGNADDVRFGHRVKAKVPAKRLPEFMTDILTYYQGERGDGERFNDFVDRVGTGPFEELAGKYRDVGALNKANLATYMDWGKTVIFKLERGEGECAI
ncbi:MAG: nitrite/sulfite reductase [Chloroflexi bacterium]|nr:nitrite/sulfite reductase [Chloroflexota bacterium]